MRYLTRAFIWARTSLGLVLTLSLGIGIPSTLWTVSKETLLRPLPVPNPDKVVRIKKSDFVEGHLTLLDHFALDSFRVLKESRQFEYLTAIQDGSKNNVFYYRGIGEPERLKGVRVTDSFFHCVGLRPRLGPGFSKDSGNRSQEVILGHELWERKFGRTRDVAGKKILLNGAPYVITGVMPDFQGQDPSRYLLNEVADLWLPFDEVGHPSNTLSFKLLGRLKDHSTTSVAASDLTALAKEESTRNGGSQIEVSTLREELIAPIRPALRLLILSGLLVFILACTNVAALLVSRSEAQSREMAIRTALGATPKRLAGDAFVEALALSLVAGLVTYATSGLWIRLSSHLTPDSIGLDHTVTPSALLIGVLSIVAALTVGLLRFAQACSTKKLYRPIGNLHSQTHQATLRRLQHIVTIEVALSMALLMGAGLMLQSYLATVSRDPGMKIERIIALNIYLPLSDFSTQKAQSVRLLDSIKRDLLLLPGIESVSLTSSVPLRSRDYYRSNWRLRKVDGDFFDLLRIPVLAGRGLENIKHSSSERVAVVNQSFADRFFSESDALGEYVDGYRIVGVVGNTAHEDLGLPPQPAVYIHHAQDPDDRMSLLVRTTTPFGNSVQEIKRTIWNLAPHQPISDIATLEDIARSSQERMRRMLLLSILGSYSLVALILSTTGIYGTVAFLCLHRKTEYALRSALGARPSQILYLIFGRGLLLARRGLLLGALLSVPLLAGLSEFLPRTASSELLACTAAAFILATPIFIASLAHARRVFDDPGMTLREVA